MNPISYKACRCMKHMDDLKHNTHGITLGVILNRENIVSNVKNLFWQIKAISTFILPILVSSRYG